MNRVPFSSDAPIEYEFGALWYSGALTSARIPGSKPSTRRSTVAKELLPLQQRSMR